MINRIPETGQGIQGEFLVSEYDVMQRVMRDRGIMVTDNIIESGISSGNVLEIGPGPGYLGLEWLKKTKDTDLYWLEISDDMRKIAEKNAIEYGLNSRIHYKVSDATKNFPFESCHFDAVFTNGSLHEWSQPVNVFNEIERVLRKGGRYFISDLKRNINLVLFFIMKNMIKGRKMKRGLFTSVRSSYLKNELSELLRNSNLNSAILRENPFGLTVTGMKE